MIKIDTEIKTNSCSFRGLNPYKSNLWFPKGLENIVGGRRGRRASIKTAGNKDRTWYDLEDPCLTHTPPFPLASSTVSHRGRSLSTCNHLPPEIMGSGVYVFSNPLSNCIRFFFWTFIPVHYYFSSLWQKIRRKRFAKLFHKKKTFKFNFHSFFVFLIYE